MILPSSEPCVTPSGGVFQSGANLARDVEQIQMEKPSLRSNMVGCCALDILHRAQNCPSTSPAP